MIFENRQDLSLEDRKISLVQLKDDQIARGSVDLVDHGTIPRTISLLFSDDAFVKSIAETGPLVFPLSVNDLRVVQVGVVPMAEQALFF